ncbi:putative glycosyl transferase [Calothrix sp. NIES-4101]|nr:putative glycosyl transferase [Calothrix sp. NIES-4101]
MSTRPKVTIIVVPRERFSYTRQSLESIYEYTKYPFELIYIDGGSPKHIQKYLETQASEKQFKLIRTDSYLSPNYARNLGLKQVNNHPSYQQNKSQYIVFIDNDVVVTSGWLQALIECGEETQATVISPLICQGTPLHEEIHCAGGESGIVEEIKSDTNQGEITRRRIFEKIYKQGRKLAEVSPKIQRQKTHLAEYHCVMVRSDIFNHIGYLDEKLLNTKEHVDFCILVNQAGGSIYLEPKSIVTYVPTENLAITDIPYYMLRWSDAWEKSSLQHLRDKWNLTEDEYFQNRYQRLGWRRNITIINPITRKMPFGKFGVRLVSKVLRILDKKINSYLTNRYARNNHISEFIQK